MDISYLKTKDLIELHRACRNDDGSYTVEGFKSNSEEERFEVFEPKTFTASEFIIFKYKYLDSNERQYNALKQMYASWYETEPSKEVG